MNYDAIIVELLARIQTLEEKVARLEKSRHFECERSAAGCEDKVSMSDIRRYLIKIKDDAARQGEPFIILSSKDIHNAMNLVQRYPMVCNAMRQLMGENDEVLYSPPSGYSSTLKIKYYLDEV